MNIVFLSEANHRGYIELETIGVSETSNTFKVQMDDGTLRVCKVFSKRKLEEKNLLKMTAQRIRSVRLLEHQNLVPIVEVQEDEDRIFVFFEYCPNGSAADRVKIAEVNSKEVFRISEQMLAAVKYMHMQGVPHTNITLDNIMFDHLMVPKLTNYGIGVETQTIFNSDIRKLNYFAPEMVTNGPRDSFAIDMWQLGICMYALSARKFPFFDFQKKNLLENILKKELSLTRFSRQMRLYIQQCLIKDQKKRVKSNGVFSDSQKFMPVGQGKDTRTLLSIPQVIKFEKIMADNRMRMSQNIPKPAIAKILKSLQKNKSEDRFKLNASTYQQHGEGRKITPITPILHRLTKNRPVSSSLPSLSFSCSRITTKAKIQASEH